MNHLIKNIIKRFTVSVRASIQPRAQKVFWLAGSLVFLLLSPVAFSAPVINGVIEGSSTAEKAEDARYERTYALWGALLSAADGETALPRLGVQDILAFTTAVHMGKSYEFSEQEIFDILPKGKETSFTIKGRGDAESREQVLHIFEDASLLFYSLQVSYEKESNLGKLRLPEDLEEADLFFAESLKQDILLLRKTSFAKSDRNQWQELAISGIWEANELTRGNVSKDTLRNHALLQSILWVGRELIEKVKKDDEWNGPTESDFDRKSFAKDFRVLRSSLEGENTDASSQGDADEYLNEVELSLYWAIRGILFYESRRVPIYNKNTGVLKSNYPAEILLAQCFNNVYNSYEEVLLPTERFPITFSPGPGEPSVTVDNQTGTRVSRWLEARSIDASPLVKDRIALDFLYANLPGEASNERNLLTILQSVQGGSSVVEVARYWANYYENHPDHRTLVQTPGRVSSSYNSARNALKERSRVYSDEGRSIDLWLKEEKEAALDEIDEAIKEGRRKVYIELTLNFVSLVALPAASEYFSGLEGISMTERDIELVKSMQAAGRAGNARLFLSMFKQLSLETQYLLTTGSEVPFYRTFAFMGAFGAQLANAYIAAPSGYSVWIGRSNLNVEGASIAAKYGTVDLFEYFASIRLALEVLETYHKPKRQGGGLEGAVKVLSDYTQRFNADLSRIHIVFSLLPSEEKTEIESAFSDVDALAIPIHSGNMIETADYILNLEPGTRWSVLEQLQDKYGLLMVVNLLATMVERSAETTAQIFMEYQHSTLLEDSSTSADGKMLQMFLGLGQLYPISNYQQKIIAACDSLELCGDFLLDIGVWTGERGYNDKGVADMLDDLNPLLAGRLLAEMYELEQERTMPDDSFVEDVIIDWLSNDDDIAEQYATAVYIMTTKQVNLNISFRNNTFANNKTKVNEYLADPVGFLLDEDGGENLLLNGGNGGGDDRGDDVLYRTMGQHVMSKGLDYWVAYLAEQLALARDLPIAAKARSAGAISLGTNNTDFMSETVYETGENIDVLAHLILGLLPNADLFPDENWAWLRSWFKYVAPHALGETLDEAYDLNKTEAFESRATKNEEDLDAITAAFLENMKPEDAAALLVAMDPEKAARILALIEDRGNLSAILEAMIRSDDAAFRSAFIAIMDAANLTTRANMLAQQLVENGHAEEIIERERNTIGNSRDYVNFLIYVVQSLNAIQSLIENSDQINRETSPQELSIFLERIGTALDVILEEIVTELDSDSESGVAAILRGLILQGQGQMAGYILVHMNTHTLTSNFLDQLFLLLLSRDDLPEERLMLTIFEMLNSMLYQSLLRDNRINYRIRAVICYLMTIPEQGEGADSESILFMPAFRGVLESDFRSYLLNHVIDLYLEGPSLENLESSLSGSFNGDATAYAINFFNILFGDTSVIRHEDVNGTINTYFNDIDIYNLSDVDLVSFLSGRDSLFVTRFLFTDFFFDESFVDDPSDDFFNQRLSIDRIIRLVILLSENESLDARWLGRVFMPASQQVMSVGDGFPDGSALIPGQTRLSLIFNRLLADNRGDVVVRMVNSISASVNDNRYAYFMIERALASMIDLGQPNNVGQFLANITSPLNQNRDLELVLYILDVFRETRDNETFISVLAAMASALNQAIGNNTQAIGDDMTAIHGFIRNILGAGGTFSNADSNRDSVAVIFIHLALHDASFSQWIIDMLGPDNILNNDGSQTRAIARIFNAMISSESSGVNGAGIAAVSRFILEVNSGRNFDETQRRLLVPLLNQMFRLQEENEIRDFCIALFEDPSRRGVGLVNTIFSLMVLEGGGAQNVLAIIQSIYDFLLDDLNSANPTISAGHAAIILSYSSEESELAADIISSMVEMGHVDQAAAILLEMETQDAVTRLIVIRSSNPQIFESLRASMALTNPDEYNTIREALEDYDNQFGSDRRDNVLSYSAIDDQDDDEYWEPRDDDGDLITNTDHHFTLGQGVRRMLISNLNYAYYFDDNSRGLGMESLEKLPGDPTEGAATFELWLSPSSLPSGDDKRVLFEGGGETEGVALILGARSVIFSVSRIGGYFKHEVVFPEALPLHKYSHLVGIIDQTKQANDQDYLRLYVNGEAADPVRYPTSTVNPNTIPAEFFINFPRDWSFNPYDWCDDGESVLGSLFQKRFEPTLYPKLENFEGWISEFHFYDRALSAAEVSSLYQSHLAAPETLTVTKENVGGLKIPELSWSQVSDASGYNIYRTQSNVTLPDPGDLIASVDGSASTTYLDEDVDPGTDYRYWITSHNYWKESNFSEVVTYKSRSGGRVNSGGGRVNSGGGRLNSGGGRLNNSNSSSNSSSNGGDRGFSRKALSYQSTASTISVSNILKPAVLMLEDYDGGGLSGYEFNPQDDSTIYLVEDGAGGTAIECVVATAGPNIHYIKLLDVAEDISTYNSLSFDYRSMFYDASSTIEIQLRFTNKQDPDVENYWNWFSPVSLSSGHGEWTRVIVELSEINFQLGVEMRPGCDFNLDSLEGIAVLINSSGQTYNIVELDNIQLSTDKSY